MSGGDPKSYRYRRVAGKLAGLIDQGVLRVGERVPSVRRISEQEGVSVSTILQAYTLLETRGYLEARPQSGFYVRGRRESLPPEPRASAPSRQATRVWVSELVSVLQAGLDPEVVPLGEACPSLELLPARRLNRMLGALARRGGTALNDHSFPPGNYELRRQVARRSIDWGANLRPEEVVTTFGATEALHLCLRAVAQPGDLVAIESPAYFGTLLLLEHLQLQAVEIPSHPRNGMDLERLADALKKHRIRACVACPNFSNPLGSCMPEESKRDLVAMLARRSIPLIEDDIWGDLYFAGTRPKTAKAFDKDGLVLLCSSFSKMLAPSYRVGWTAAGRYQAKVESLKLTATMETSTLLQTVVAEFLENGGYDRHLRKLRAALALQIDQVLAAIGEHFPAGTKVTRPAGGFVLWVELPRGVKAIDLHSRALAERISIAPGPLFSARKGYQNYIRLSCGSPWSPRLEAAIATLGRLARG
ncbi:MAG TPA: PLP-dependent aminotransferase family protein [Bryobacteraceae bacterium]|nr:PLP-dependent aminotransferase family protein [Bryobacteraceae bacterium]